MEWIMARKPLGVIDGFFRFCHDTDLETIRPERNRCSLLPLKGNGSTSNLFLLSVGDGRDKRQSYFVKCYWGKDDGELFWLEQLKRDFKVSRAVGKALTQSLWFKVPKTYFTVPEEVAIVSEYIDGKNLGQYCSRILRWSALQKGKHQNIRNLVYRIGRGLEELQAIPCHRFDTILPSPSAAKLCSEYIQFLEERAFFLAQQRVSADLVSKACSAAVQILDRYLRNDPMYCFQHTDFILQNFTFNQKGELYLYDFPNATVGVPFMDVAHFIGSLEDLTYLRAVSKSRVEELIHLFVSLFERKAWFKREVFLAFQLYIEFHSTMILLSQKKSVKRAMCTPWLFERPEKRFEERVTVLLDQIT